MQIINTLLFMGAAPYSFRELKRQVFLAFLVKKMFVRLFVAIFKSVTFLKRYLVFTPIWLLYNMQTKFMLYLK